MAMLVILVALGMGCATKPTQEPQPKRWAVLVHGIFDDPSRFHQLVPVLEAADWRVLPVELTPNDSTASLRTLALDVRAAIEREIPPSDDVVLIGYSMGGLVCRSYVQEYEGWRRASALLTVASPNRGTVMSRLLMTKGAREMRPGSAFLKSLNQDRLSYLKRIRHGAIYSPLDGVILPSTNAQLPSGWHHRLRPILHAFIMSDKETINAIMTFINGKA